MTDAAPLRWRKSSRSGSTSDCVEVPHTRDRLRDSKHTAVELTVGQDGWSAFLATAKNDGFTSN
ncbi:DUF397 domain-containing protein [Lentzea sp. NPDC092896]|uniref:DUF397 domain-containing protein n=1 Tax=Lentzea sp. NPDC092896 TaxID=3364127 RepID=UPI003827A97B